MKVGPSNRRFWPQLAGLVLGVLTFCWGVFVWVNPKSSHEDCLVTVVDQSGIPARVILIGPDGDRAPTDDLGIARVRCSWIGTTVSIRKTVGGLELMVLRLVNSNGDMIRVVLP